MGPANRVDHEHVPADQEPLWEGLRSSFLAFRSPRWWRRLWSEEQGVTLELADMMPCSWCWWLRWALIQSAWNGEPTREVSILTVPSGRDLGFVRLLAARRS